MQIITTHLNADFDCLASMLSAKKLYPEAKLVFSGSLEKNLKDFLEFSDYSFGFEKLKNIEFQDIDLLILVDTMQKSRIGPFSDVLDKPGLQIHIYDHHPSREKDINGTFELIRETGATTTMFVEILKEREIPITPEEATIMALGIYEDTGSLTFSSTKPEDLKAASYLLSKGANLNTVSDFISKELTGEQVTLLNDLIQNCERYTINGVEIVITTSSYERYIGDLAVLVHKLKDMENLNVLFALVRMGNGVHMVARSRIEAVDVSDIASEFGGGGHPTAASASIKGMALYQAEEKLIAVLKKKIHFITMAGDIMTSPIKMVSCDSTIKEAEEIMTRYNMNALPVIREEKPIGIITRQTVEKAIFHKFTNERATEFMLSEFYQAFPDTPFHEIEEWIIDRLQKLVPVVDEKSGRLLGGITRGQIMQVLHDDLLKKPAMLDKRDIPQRYSHTKNLRGLIKERLPERIKGIFQKAGEVADREELSVYAAGGLVRDLLLRVENFDVDIVVEGNGIEFARKLAKELSGRMKSHEKFATAVVVLPDGFKIDVASARLEYYEYPSAPPVVEFASIKNDLLRRDFTINALAMKLNGRDAYTLIDFFGGQRDLKDRVLRVLHNLSFVEDPTRVFRAIRFEQRYNLTIGKQTMVLMENAIKKNLYSRLASKRLFLELHHMLSDRYPLKMVRRMGQLDVLRFIHPKIVYTAVENALFKNIVDVIAWFELSFLNLEVDKWYVYYLGMISGLDNQEADELADALLLSEKLRKRIREDREKIRRVLPQLANRTDFRPSELYNLLSGLSVESLLYMMSKLKNKESSRQVSFYLTQLRSIDIEVSGDDLKEMGLKPGPEFKKVFDTLRELKLNGKLKDKEAEMRYIRKNFVHAT
jgi:tRNA nucleotidyltransferase (CCA-adding enzyme)